MKNLMFCLLFACPLLSYAQNMDEKIKMLANEIADQVVKNGAKKVAVIPLGYKNGCSTEFGQLLAEDLTGNLAVAGRPITVVNQKLLGKLLEQNKLNAQRLVDDPEGASRLGRASGIDAFVYGTISTLGEEVRLSVSIVRLPTLTVFGYARSQMPLTGGIKAMLTCQETGDPQSDQQGPDSALATSKAKCAGRNIGGALITVQACVLNSRQVECGLLITNDRADKADATFRYAPSQSYIITDTGRQYPASFISMGNSAMDYGMSMGYTAVYGVKVTGVIRFSVEDSSIKSMQILEMKDQGLRCANVPVVSSGSK